MMRSILTTCLLLILLLYVSGGALLAHQQLFHAESTEHHDHESEAPQPQPGEDPCEVCDMLVSIVAAPIEETSASAFTLPCSITLAPRIAEPTPIHSLFTRSSRAPPRAHL